MRATCLVLALVLSPVSLVRAASGADAVRADHDETTAHVDRFTPQGTVKQVRQASARFSVPMVALGDPRLSAPFDVDCPETGSGRWVDTRTWAYDFIRDLPAGITCRFTLRSGVVTVGGAPVTAGTFAFSTGGPAIVRVMPDPSGPIAEDQIFVLSLDGTAEPASIVEHAGFTVQGLPERVPLQVLEGAEREAVVRTLDDWQREEPFVVVAARRRFPNGAAVELVWGPGIQSAGGVAGETPQTFRWTVRPVFTAELTCDRESANRGCIPLTPVVLHFTAPVRMVAGEPCGAGRARRSPLDAAPPENEDWTTDLTFAPPFPPDATVHVELPSDVVDDAGRTLENGASFPLAVRIDGEPPLAKFASRFGIIESKADPTLPVTVRNLEPDAGGRQLRVGGRVARIPAADALDWLRRVAVSPRTRSVFAGTKPPAPARPIKLPRAADDKAAEVIGIPLGEPGLYVVELASMRLGAALLGTPAPVYVPTAALVTNLSVHLKWGREASLVWVTTLDGARPVAGARVSVTDCTGKTLAAGTTDADGLARFARLPWDDALPACDLQWPENFFDWRQIQPLRGLSGGLLVLAESGDDLGMVHSSWDQGIESFRFDLPSESYDGPVVAHTVLDRTLFRAGETVHMKHVLRQQSLDGFSAVPPEQRPTVLSVRHLGSDEHFEQPLAWRDDGSAESTWAIPRAAKLGRYEVVLVVPPAAGKPEWLAIERRAGSFRVEEFRVPLMRGVVQLPAGPLIAAKKVAADLGVPYLAGGAASSLPVVLRGEIRPRVFPTPAGLDAYTFANGPVRTGVFRDGEDGEGGEEKPRALARQQLTLDAAGTGTRPSRAAAPPDVAARAAGRAGVPRSQRRSADGGDDRAAVAGGLAAGAAHRALGTRARRPGGARRGGRRTRRARRRRAGPDRRPRPPHVLDARPRRRRVLRLPAHHGGAAHRPALRGRDGCPGPPRLQRPSRRAGRRRARGDRHRPAGTRGGRERRRLGGARRGDVVRGRATAIASTCCPSGVATSRARPRASRCACRSARRPRWSPSIARAWGTRASSSSRAPSR